MSARQQFMPDPRPSTNLDTNNRSVSEDDKTQELSVSPSNATMEVMSKQRDHPLTKLVGKQACFAEDGNFDQSFQSWGSSKSPKLDDSKSINDQEQVAEIPFRKARVSVRARSEAPLVILLLFFILNIS